MKRRLLTLMMLLVAATFVAEAHPVDMTTASEVAIKFMKANAKVPLRGAEDLQLVTTYNISRGDAAFYVFNTPNGFVIVSADDCAMPVLGYSDEGQFDENDIPIQLQDYLQDFVEQIQYGIENHLEADEATALQWESVLTMGCLTEKKSGTVVEPLLTDIWHQTCYYNDKCPEDSTDYCGHVLAGCVATSFAQIMHYWGYPVTGRGSHTYKPARYPQQTADFGATTYDWANMPDSLTSSSTSAQIDAVATLIWHCGVAVNMNYGVNGSGAYSSDIPKALKDYFGYSTELFSIYKSNYTNENWLTRLKDCLDLGYPIHYSGQNAHASGGHAFVCDGYDANNLLHFNWGWGGVANGYFTISALNPNGYVFTRDNMAIVNIHPDCTPGTSYQISVTANPSNGGTVSGMGTYDCGEVCTLTATTDEGYAFDNWTKDGAVVSCFSTCEMFVTDTAEYVANFRQVDGIVIGDASYANSNLPANNYLSLSEQIYTAEEIGMEAGEISSVSFFNAGYAFTRNFSVYMVNTSKTAFESPADWISVEDADLVFSGDVAVAYKDWTTIYFNTPFNYDGTSNIALIIDDNKNSSNGNTYCRTFSTEESQALYINGSGTNYDPYNPTGYMGTLLSEKNQIILGMPTYEYTVTVSASPEEGGAVSGGGGLYYYGQPIPINAVPNEGYVFNNWTKNDEVVSFLSSDYVPVTETAEYVASFQQMEGIAIGDASYVNSLLPCSVIGYSLTQQIYTADEMRVGACSISSVSFFSASDYTRTRTVSIYMTNTDKAAFENTTDWIEVTEEDLVFSGSVAMTPKSWTTIYFNTPFEYDGVSNVALILDNNTGKLTGSSYCRVFDADGYQSIVVSTSNVNYDPCNPSVYTGTLNAEKNQVIFGIPSYDYTATVSANPPEGGTVSGGEGSYFYGQPVPFVAMPNEGYVFNNWTKNGEVVSCLSADNIPVTETAEYVANFELVDDLVIGEAVCSSAYLPSYSLYSLSQQIYTADELNTEACEIYSMSFFNTGDTATRTLSVYLALTNKEAFDSRSDWITVSEEDQVFSGSVTIAAKSWTTISFNTPFNYDGASNLVVVVNNMTGNSTGSLSCRAFGVEENQAIYAYSALTSCDPYNPSSYTGTLMTEKNQVIFGIEACVPQLQQTMEIVAGANWFSSNVEITLDDLKAALVAAAPGTVITIQSQTLNTSYNPANGRWTGQLTTLDVTRMYVITVTTECELVLNGVPVNPAEHPVTIESGANWIAYPLDESMTLTDAFAGFAVQGDVVQSQTNNAQYIRNNWMGQLTELVPGKGYIYNSSTTESRVFTFPSSK